MKKFRNILLFFCLIALMTGSQAFAAGSTSTNSLIRNFDEFERQLKHYTDTCRESFTLNFVTDMATEIQKDPVRFQDTIFSNGIAGWSGRDNRSGFRYRVDFRVVYYPGKKCAYAYSSDNREILSEDENRLLDKALEIASSIDGNEENTVKQIYDYLCDHVSYCTEDNATADVIYTAAGALLDGEAVSNGYADAFYLLCSLKGLEAMYVMGGLIQNDETTPREQPDTVLRVWNAVKLHEKWYMVDVASGDQKSGISYLTYLLGTDMMSKHHVWSAVFPEPVSRETFSRTENPLIEVKNWLNAEAQIRQAYRQNIKRLSLVGLDFISGSVQVKRIISSLGVAHCLYYAINDSCEIVFD